MQDSLLRLKDTTNQSLCEKKKNLIAVIATGSADYNHFNLPISVLRTAARRQYCLTVFFYFH